jgi:hypothetical protein
MAKRSKQKGLLKKQSMNSAKPRPEKKPSAKESFASAQKLMAQVIMRPLDGDSMQTRLDNRKSIGNLADSLIKPNHSLTSFERLEIYNKQYWYRILDSLEEDFEGVLTILGREKFCALCEAYVSEHPSRTFTLRDLGNKLPEFIRLNPGYAAPYARMAYETALLEWAEINAMDAATHPPLAIEKDSALNVQTCVLMLQPHTSVLKLNYAVDDFLVEFRKETTLQLVSNACIGRSTGCVSRSRPKAEKNFLVVHRCDNTVYFKRVKREEYLTLLPFVGGATIEQACENVYQKASRADREKLPDKLTKSFSQWSSLKLLWLADACDLTEQAT